MKKCCICKEYLDTANFCKDKSRGDGFSAKCRGCQKVLDKRKKDKDPDAFRQKAKENTRRYRARLTPEQRAEIRLKENEAIKAPSVRAKRRENCRRYYATKNKATPKWLTPVQKQQINDLYYLAKDCEITSGYTYHVDHIVPIKGRTVCGLHVPWNLQVVPSDVNIRKSNNLVL